MPDTPVEPILYTQAGCAESEKVRAWLSAQDIGFSEQNASIDPEAATALAATGIFATPLLVVGDHKILGFQPKTFVALLNGR